jgi:hypothetical protein
MNKKVIYKIIPEEERRIDTLINRFRGFFTKQDSIIRNKTSLVKIQLYYGDIQKPEG